jgi:hypothetical protein
MVRNILELDPQSNDWPMLGYVVEEWSLFVVHMEGTVADVSFVLVIETIADACIDVGF